MHRPEESPPFISSCTLQKPLEVYKGLTVPLLILDAVGHDSNYRDTTRTEENNALAAAHPELVKHVRYKTGHYVHRERPDEFINELKGFLKQVER